MFVWVSSRYLMDGWTVLGNRRCCFSPKIWELIFIWHIDVARWCVTALLALANRPNQQSKQKEQPMDLKSVELDQKLRHPKRTERVCNKFNGLISWGSGQTRDSIWKRAGKFENTFAVSVLLSFLPSFLMHKQETDAATPRTHRQPFVISQKCK